MNTQRRTTIARGQPVPPKRSGEGGRSEVKGQRSEVRSQRSVFRRPSSPVRRPSSVVCRPSSGFTLVELLVVISIIALLLGIIVPSYFSIREKAKYTKAKVTAKNLETAFKAYLDHYRTWPAAWKEADINQQIDVNVVNILKGENDDKIAFYEFESTNSTDGALDAWSEPSDSTTWQTYRFRVDENYDNKIGNDLYRTVIVWSPGADRTNDTSDDVKSWD